MHARQINWTLVVTIFLVSFVWGISSATASGQGYDRQACDSMSGAAFTAMERKQWDVAVSSWRLFYAGCRHLLSTDGEAVALDQMGASLYEQKKFGDAVPILERCVTIKPDSAACFENLGRALEGMGDFVRARKAYERAISIGGYDDLSATSVKYARQHLAELPPEDKPPQTSPSDGEPPTTTASKRFGTGFVVSAEGHILTNNHVVAGCRTLTTRDGQPLEILSRNGDSDLALLRQPKGSHNESTSVPVAVFRTGSAPELGDVVVAFGFPLPGVLSSEGNVSTGILSATSGLGNDVRFIQISAPVQPGNSGGPLFDSSGHVIGVVVAKLDAVRIAEITGDIPQNVNFAVQWAAVRTFLDQAKVPYRTEVSLHSTPTRNIAAAAERIAVTIECAE
jgi:S1-C subfamily serine protease